MTRVARDDFRLGAPAATGPALDHVCPICEGEGDTISGHCYCDGRGVITAEQAARIAADDPDPRWQPRPLPAPPRFTGKPCEDCAFRPDSLERDGATAAELYARLARGGDTDGGAGFYCHQGMHHGAQGYVPRQRDARGAPIGHPICAGWLAQYRKALPPMKLGDIVTLTEGAKIHRPHVVVNGPGGGRVQLCYFGSGRWYVPEWHPVDRVSAKVPDSAQLRRCRRTLAAMEPGPDGWKRIEVGRYGQTQTVIVGHVDVPWSWQP